MKFLKKQEAINFYNNKLKKKVDIPLKLFAEDIDKAGSKHFYVCETKEIYNKIERQQTPHFYEFWTDKTKLSFGIDIDYIITKSDMEPDQLLKQVILIVIEAAKKYYDHKYKISDVIVLENEPYSQQLDNPNKYSAHLIFRGLTFENNLVAKDFYLRMVKDYKLNTYFVDKSIYNLTCLRLVMNSKKGKKVNLIPKVLEIKGKLTKKANNFYDFFLDSMITHTNSSDKIVKDIKYKSDQQIKTSDNISDISNINIEHILDNLPAKYYNEYEYWIKVGMILFQYNTEENNFYNLWNSWSSQSFKYKESEMINKWNSFAKLESKITIGSLIKWAKDEGIDNIYKNNKQSIDQIVNSYPSKPIQIKLNNSTLLSQAKLIPDIYYPILNKKLIGIQSEKGTGKTSNLLTALFKSEHSIINEKTSILFISSRITFGYKLLGDLEEYGFELYSNIKDQQIYNKRIICQIDSLMRLENDTYDMIIVDESESLCRYLTSTHFTKNPKASLIVSTFEMRITDAKQVFIMDADLSDRCVNYFQSNMSLRENDYHLIINDFKPYEEYKLTYCQYATWLRKILLILESNKKIVVAMASNAKAKDLNKKLNDTYPDKKILFIHRETTDEDKKNLLLKVNDEWTKYDVVIYTPSVCMGVSFDITGHFDHIFAYGCHESLGAQEFCQMIHRVRSPINKEIFVAIDQYRSFELEDTVTYNTVEKMLCSDYYLTNYDLHNNLIPKKVTRVSNLDEGIIDENEEKEEKKINTIGSITKNDKILYYPYKTEPIYDLYVRNSWELIDNKLNFTACFFGYVKYKNYNLEYLGLSDEDLEILNDMKLIREEREEHELEEKITGILESPDLSSEDYLNKIKQKDEYITKEDIYCIQRYNLRKCYNYQNSEINRDFIIEYHNKDKMKWYRNISTVLTNNDITTELKLNILKDNEQYGSIISNCYVDFTNKNKYSYHYYPLEIIKLLGFDINNLIISIRYPDLLPKIYDTVAWCDTKKEEIAYKYSIKTACRSLITMGEVEQLKYLNRIIESQYGLRIKRINNSIYKDNILYRLEDNSHWDNLPNKVNNDDSNLQSKIIPYDLTYKRLNNNNNEFDSSNLDIFID